MDIMQFGFVPGKGITCEIIIVIISCRTFFVNNNSSFFKASKIVPTEIVC